ncbi:hypothetical protein GH733_015971 [Mirounga leonina]|nr:hypothetical protein GH733_015971 [Mirounga leonina]
MIQTPSSASLEESARLTYTLRSPSLMSGTCNSIHGQHHGPHFLRIRPLM